MTTRESILEAVLKNQPPSTALPDIGMFKGNCDQAIENIWKFSKQSAVQLFWLIIWMK